MGTRNLTCVVAGGAIKVAQYGQWDGYPGGQGATVYGFCTEHLDTLEKVRAYASRVHRLRWLRDEEGEKLFEDRNANPYVSRDMGAKILEFLHERVDVEAVRDSADFAADSLFCEWAYVVDLDAGALEVYRGFQTKPHEAGRFAKLPHEQQHRGENQYYPVALLCSFSLSDMPASKDAFVKAVMDMLPQEEDDS